MAARVIPPMIRDVVLIGFGGAAGTLARYLLSASLASPDSDGMREVWVTSGINVVGATLLGLLVSICAARYPRAQMVLGAGVLGGFTTYSLLAVDAVTHGIAGVGIGVASVLAGVAGALLGVVLGAKVRGVRDRRNAQRGTGGEAT